MSPARAHHNTRRAPSPRRNLEQVRTLPRQRNRRTKVSEHHSLAEGFTAGQDAVHADTESAYVLCHDIERMARFGYSRLQDRAGGEIAIPGLVL